MSIHLPKTSFTRGAISETLSYGRELEIYAASVSRCFNWLPLVERAVTRRPGTRFMGYTKDGSVAARFVAFTFSTGQSYILEFGDLYVRFWTLGGILTSGGSEYEIVTPYTTDDLDGLQFASKNDVIFIASPNYAPKRLSRLGATSWTLDDVPFVSGPFLNVNDDKTSIVKLTTNTNATAPLLTGQIVTVTLSISSSTPAGLFKRCIGQEMSVTFDGYTSILKVVDITGTGYYCVVTDGQGGITGTDTTHTFKYVHYNNTTNTIEFDDFVEDASADCTVALYDTGLPSAVTGSTIDLEFSVDQGLTSDDIGRHFRLQLAGKWSWAEITAVSDGQNCTVEVMDGNGNSDTDSKLRITSTRSFAWGAFSPRTGWPACVTFHKGRLFWSNTADYPRGLFASSSGLPYDYSPTEPDGTVIDSNGFFRDIVSDGQNADPILWLNDSYRLQLGTASHIKTIGSSDSSTVLSPASFDERVDITTGSHTFKPIAVDGAHMMIGRTKQGLHDIFTDGNSGFLSAPEMSILSRDLLKVGVEELVFAKVPDTLLLARMSDGTLVSVSINRSEKVAAFATHDIGGVVESMAVMAAEDRDEIWMIVRRTLNGSTTRTVERLEKRFDGKTDDYMSAMFLDCGISYDGAAQNEFSGADHLAGETVTVLADGSVYEDIEVNSTGTFVLPNEVEASIVIAGLQQDNEVVLLQAPYQSPDGSAIGAHVRPVEAVIGMAYTRGLKCASESGGTYEDIATPSADDMVPGVAPPLVSGTHHTTFDDAGWDGGAAISLKNTPALPATIAAINLYVDGPP